MGRKGVDCGCGAREDILDRLAALRQRVEVLETEINQVESQFPDVLRDVRSAEASAVSAAESAESSREIVEGYDDRLGAVEQGVIDVNDYAEAIGDDVSAIDTEIHTTRPYVDTNTEQTVTAKKHIPTATVNDDSDVWVNKAFVQATDGRNNLVHNMATEYITGQKYLKGISYPNLRFLCGNDSNGTPSANNWAGLIGKAGSEESNVTNWELYYIHSTNNIKQMIVNLPKNDGSFNGLVISERDANDNTFGFGVNSAKTKVSLNIQSNVIDRTETPTTGQTTPAVKFLDKNGLELGHIGIYSHSNGKLYMQLALWSKQMNRLVSVDLGDQA